MTDHALDNAHDEALDDEVTALLSAADHRYTDGRRRLVAALHASDRPLTITQIVEADGALPQSTIYRNLTILEDVGAVTRIASSDEFSRYELAEQLTEHHHHLICSSCGDIADFSLDAEVESTLAKALERAAEDAGFAIEAHRLDLLGTCATCRQSS